jgi:hypothetical protein
LQERRTVVEIANADTVWGALSGVKVKQESPLELTVTSLREALVSAGSWRVHVVESETGA